MSEVSWDSNYNINIEHVDGTSVHHIREALKKYKMGNVGMNGDAQHCFDQIIEICGFITDIDDRD